MSLPLTLLLVGLIYAVLYGLFALMRRESLSTQFALEAVAITALFSGFTALTKFPTHPVVFVIVLYVLTMRTRLLVDLGTTFARSKRFHPAEQLYHIAARLLPDRVSQAIIKVNLGTLCLQQGKLEEARTLLNEVLSQTKQGQVGVKYEAAAHYNLAVTLQRMKLDAQAVAEFNAVLDTWPHSEFARRASQALDQIQKKETHS